MAFYQNYERFEFDLTIKHYGNKERKQDPYSGIREREEEKPVEELKEKLTFNSRTAVEVIRKLLDYIQG
jgi:hypothetical protein